MVDHQTPKQQKEAAQVARLRQLSLVIIVTSVLWVGFQWLGPQLGLAGEYAFLIDLAAMAAFIWALLNGLALWRERRAEREQGPGAGNGR